MRVNRILTIPSLWSQLSQSSILLSRDKAKEKTVKTSEEKYKEKEKKTGNPEKIGKEMTVNLMSDLLWMADIMSGLWLLHDSYSSESSLWSKADIRRVVQLL